MTVMVALLRGINVGGHAKLPMAQLREVAESAGFEHVRTYIQSGNVVFRTTRRSAKAVGEALGTALAEQTDVTPDVMVRSQAELEAVVAANPFATLDLEPRQLHVFFQHEPATKALAELDLDPFLPEEAVAVGRELYLHLPDGLGRSKLAEALGKAKAPSRTARNWRTVTTLVEMANEVAAAT